MIPVKTVEPPDVDAAAVAKRLEEHLEAVGRGVPFEFDGTLYRRYRVKLEEFFHDKCGYCETHLTGKNKAPIEHYRPKGAVTDVHHIRVDHPGYWWTAYSWGNLFPICDACNQKKLNRFPVNGTRACATHRTLPQLFEELKTEQPLLLNPLIIDFDPLKEFTFEHSGKDAGKIIGLTERARATIEVCSLNRPKLMKARAHEMSSARLLAGFIFNTLAVLRTPDLINSKLEPIKRGETQYSLAVKWTLQQIQDEVQMGFRGLLATST